MKFRHVILISVISIFLTNSAHARYLQMMRQYAYVNATPTVTSPAATVQHVGVHQVNATVVSRQTLKPVAQFKSQPPQLQQYTDGTNLYQYCKSDPVNYVDPWGLSSEKPKSYNERREETRKKYIWGVKGKPGRCTRFVNIDGHGDESGFIAFGDGEDLFAFGINDMPDPGKCCCTVDIIFKTCYAGKNKDGVLEKVASSYKSKCPNSRIRVKGCSGKFQQFGWSTGPGYCAGRWIKVEK